MQAFPSERKYHVLTPLCECLGKQSFWSVTGMIVVMLLNEQRLQMEGQ